MLLGDSFLPVSNSAVQMAVATLHPRRSARREFIRPRLDERVQPQLKAFSSGASKRRLRRAAAQHPRAARLPAFILERATRIELAFSAWEADVLPLNYAR